MILNAIAATDHLIHSLNGSEHDLLMAVIRLVSAIIFSLTAFFIRP
jgi:hypothetical protein